jgi:hypothetical protein
LREISDILLFREDISPFLVHLCRDLNDRVAGQSLEAIISHRQLQSLGTEISDARFGINTVLMTNQDKMRYFGAVCLTETPINEIHCLLEIARRNVQLAPYGFVFVKERLQAKGVSPVIYINNEHGDKDTVIAALCSLIQSASDAAAEILPLVSVFGRKLRPPGATHALSGSVDFRWEREWRFPSVKGALQFDLEDVFIGLCPDQYIQHFEGLMPGVAFIDPMRNMKWYASKLIAARQRLDLKYSVV